MRKLIGGTWCIAALFAMPILGIEMLSWVKTGVLEGFLIGSWATLPIVAACMAGLTWWLLVMRTRSTSVIRGTLVGALIAALILAVPTLSVAIQIGRRGPMSESGLVDAAGIVSFAFFWAVGLPLGAVFGTLAMTIQHIGAKRGGRAEVLAGG